MTTFINCFNESLRIQPPVYFSSPIAMSETVQVGPLSLRKGDLVVILIYHLCNNPNEWIEPEKFIPERFSSESKYFLRPDGKKRNPYSFSPFLGGQRICMGKTFVEAVSKLVVPVMTSHFTWELKGVDKDKFEFPHNNFTMTESPNIPVTIARRNIKYKGK